MLIYFSLYIDKIQVPRHRIICVQRMSISVLFDLIISYIKILESLDLVLAFDGLYSFVAEIILDESRVTVKSIEVIWYTSLIILKKTMSKEGELGEWLPSKFVGTHTKKAYFYYRDLNLWIASLKWAEIWKLCFFVLKWRKGHGYLKLKTLIFKSIMPNFNSRLV